MNGVMFCIQTEGVKRVRREHSFADRPRFEFFTILTRSGLRSDRELGNFRARRREQGKTRHEQKVSFRPRFSTFFMDTRSGDQMQTLKTLKK